jgi:hypothetical protein
MLVSPYGSKPSPPTTFIRALLGFGMTFEPTFGPIGKEARVSVRGQKPGEFLFILMNQGFELLLA